MLCVLEIWWCSRNFVVVCCWCTGKLLYHHWLVRACLHACVHAHVHTMLPYQNTDWLVQLTKAKCQQKSLWATWDISLLLLFSPFFFAVVNHQSVVASNWWSFYSKSKLIENLSRMLASIQASNKAGNQPGRPKNPWCLERPRLAWRLIGLVPHTSVGKKAHYAQIKELGLFLNLRLAR